MIHLAMITHRRKWMAKLLKIKQVTFGVTTGCKKTIQLGHRSSLPLCASLPLQSPLCPFYSTDWS